MPQPLAAAAHLFLFKGLTHENCKLERELYEGTS